MGRYDQYGATESAIAVGDTEFDDAAGGGELARTQATQGGPGAEIGSTVRDAAQQAQHKAGELVERAKDQGRHQLTTQKDRTADTLESLSQSIRRIGQDARGQEQSTVADLAETAAGQTERLSQFLREADVDEIVARVSDFGRRQPALVLGGGFILGLLAARFLKASGAQASEARKMETIASADWDAGYTGTSGIRPTRGRRSTVVGG